MLFTFDATTSGGLRVIPTIPNITRCWLEGRNGIGKTVAVRLLELVAGKQPFTSDIDAWRALKDNLGPTTIAITEFPPPDNIQSIRIDLTPDQWPEDPVQLNSTLGNVFIDSQPADHHVLRKHLDVVRIGGNETAVSQIRNLVGEDFAVAMRCRQQLEETAGEVSNLLTPLIMDIDRLSESAVTSADHDMRLAQRKLQVVDSQMKAASQRQIDLEELLRLSEIQEEQAKHGPAVRASLKDATSNVKTLTDQKSRLADQLRDLVPQHAASQQLQHDLEKLQRSRDGRRRRAAHTHSTAQRALKSAGLQATTIHADLQCALTQRGALRRDRASLTSLPGLLELIDHTRSSLVEVEGSSLDTEVVAVVEGQKRLTALALRLGLDARTDELKGHLMYGKLAEIDTELSRLDQRIDKLNHILSLLADAERKKHLLIEVEKEMATKAKLLQDSSGTDYVTVSDRLAQLESDLTDAISRSAELKVHFDLLNSSGGSDRLKHKISELEGRLGITAKRAPKALDDLGLSQQELAQSQHSLRQEAAEREAIYHALLDDLGRTIELVTRGSDYHWLREHVPSNFLPTITTDRQEALRRLMELGRAARYVQQQLEASLNQAAAVEGALHGIRDSIATHREPLGNPYSDGLVQWYESQMAENFSNDDVQDAIFNGGTFQRFDLVNGFVHWHTTAGEHRRRPIEAFSSGERAFAYMLSAILSHKETTARYRIFFLDEFGAFVEHGRRSRLWRFLDERLVKQGLAAQVVVILPLQGDTIGYPEATKVEAEGYFAKDAPL